MAKREQVHFLVACGVFFHSSVQLCVFTVDVNNLRSENVNIFFVEVIIMFLKLFCVYLQELTSLPLSLETLSVCP